jgi:hypothetical protein
MHTGLVSPNVHDGARRSAWEIQKSGGLCFLLLFLMIMFLQL